jgi:hypothetical protein
MERHHLVRNPHGEFQRVSGGGSSDLQAKIQDIERGHHAATSRLTRQITQVQGMSPSTKAIIKGHNPDQPVDPKQALDHRTVVAHTRNAVHQIDLARQNGQLSPADADKISSAVNSLSKAALAADSETHRLAEEAKQRDQRLADLEQAVRDLSTRQAAQIRNEQVKDRLASLQQRKEEMIAQAHEEADKHRGLVTAIGAALANLGITLGAFFALPGTTPVSMHEWLLAIIPVATAISQAIIQPLYQAHQEKKLKRRVQSMKKQAHGNIIKQLANSQAEDGAAQFLAMVFTSAGLSSTQAQELAEDLITTR